MPVNKTDCLVDHFEKTVLYTVVGIMIGLLLLLSFILCLILISNALRRRKKRRILKRLGSSSRANTSTQTAESCTLIPSPSEHDFGLELLRFMHNGPPMKRDGRSAWMDALERQPLKAPRTNPAPPVATVESQHRLYIPVSSERLCDSFQQESAHGKSWYSPSCKGEQSLAYCKPSNAVHSPFATNSPNQVSPSDDDDLSSRGLISNCTTRDHLGTAAMPFICKSSDQLHQPRGVSSFLQVQPPPSDTVRPGKEMLPNSRSKQGPFELSPIENKTNLESSLVVLSNASSSSKGLSRSLQNSPRDTDTTSFNSFYSNPNRHNAIRLTSRSTHMLSN